MASGKKHCVFGQDRLPPASIGQQGVRRKNKRYEGARIGSSSEGGESLNVVPTCRSRYNPTLASSLFPASEYHQCRISCPAIIHQLLTAYFLDLLRRRVTTLIDVLKSLSICDNNQLLSLGLKHQLVRFRGTRVIVAT